jgi:hypothetical protein
VERLGLSAGDPFLQFQPANTFRQVSHVRFEDLVHAVPFFLVELVKLLLVPLLEALEFLLFAECPLLLSVVEPFVELVN